LKETQEDFVLHDNGGSRSGQDRRQNIESYEGQERRSGRERRRGADRRCGQSRRKIPDRRSSKFWEGGLIERRDAFRNKKS
jgi:hypothetical protein